MIWSIEAALPSSLGTPGWKWCLCVSPDPLQGDKVVHGDSFDPHIAP